MSAGTATPRTPVDLSECSEGDVVEFFKAGLRAFIANDGGSWRARRYPKAGAHAPPTRTSHCSSARKVSSKSTSSGCSSSAGSKRVGACPADSRTPCSAWPTLWRTASPGPSKGRRATLCMPSCSSTQLALARCSLGFSGTAICASIHDRLDSACKNVVQRVVSLSGAASRQLLPPWQRKAALRKVLDEALTGIADVVAEVINDESLASLFDADRTRGRTPLGLRGAPATVVPYVSWGEFFEDVLLGATFITVNGSPNGPPTPDVFPGGIGLRLLGAGSHATAWAQRELADHVALWARTVLEPPAAVIAYESFSRGLQLIEISP